MLEAPVCCTGPFFTEDRFGRWSAVAHPLHAIAFVEEVRNCPKVLLVEVEIDDLVAPANTHATVPKEILTVLIGGACFVAIYQRAICLGQFIAGQGRTFGEGTLDLQVFGASAYVAPISGIP